MQIFFRLISEKKTASFTLANMVVIIFVNMFVFVYFFFFFLTNIHSIQGSRGTQDRGLLNEVSSMDMKVGSDGYEDIEDSNLTPELRRLRFYCFGKHPLGSLFHKVVVWNILLINGI